MPSPLFIPVRPRGTPICERIKPPRTGPFNRELRLAARALDHTLGDGDLKSVTTRVEETAYLGTTSKKPSAEYDPFSRMIRVSPASRRPATDWLHEIAHVLYADYVVAATRQVGAALLDPLWLASRESVATGYLFDLERRLTLFPDTQKDIRYLLDPEEQFARSFAQFVAVRSNVRELRDEIARWSLRAVIDVPLFWDDEDFATIDREMVVLFRKLGWIRT